MQFSRPYDLHQTEVTLVLEDETRVVFEMQNGVCELRVVRVGTEQHELTAHPQMRDQRAAAREIEQDVLAAAVDKVYPRVL